MSTTLRTRSRSGTLSTLAGMAMGIVAVGLVLPFVVGEPGVDTAVRTADRPDGVAATNDAEGLAGAAPAAPVGTGPEAATAAEGRATPPGGTGSVDAGESPEPAGTQASATRPASDVGVTATTLHVGVVIPDLGTIGRSGFDAAGDPEETVRWWQAYIDELNDRGGVAGRKLVATFRVVDIISESDRRAACLELTEDEEVFAVLMDQALQRADVLCVTEEHGRPFVAGADLPGEVFRRSRGLLFSHDAPAGRVLANMAWLYDAERGLDDRRIGVVSNEGSNAAVEEGLLPALAALGHEVVHHSRLPQLPTDAEAQVPVEVSEMRRKGVDLVFLAIDPINGSLFVRQADAQLFRPQWVTADYAANTNDTAANYHGDAYEGAVAVTALRAGWFRADEPEAPFDAECQAVLQRRLGARRDPRREPSAAESTQYATSTRACSILQLFGRGARAAGAELTAATFSAAMQHLGPVDLGYSPPGSLQPGKFAAGGDRVRLLRFSADCGDGENCWIPASGWRPSHFGAP